jgi:hypothetical protein
VLRNNKAADFTGTVPSTILPFHHHHHHLKYDDWIDLLHNFQLLRKTALLGSDEIVKDNRCFNDLKKCRKFAAQIHPLEMM